MTAIPNQCAVPRKVLVVGLGNPDRGDDGVGTIVAHSLAGRLPADVTVIARSGDMLSLIEDWAGFDALVCVDASAPLATPGRIHRIDLATDELAPDISFASSHALGVAEAIELARTLGLAPRDMVVYAIEGACFNGGAPITPAIAAAAAKVAELVAAEVYRLRLTVMESQFMHETGIVRNLVLRLEGAARERGAVGVRGVDVWIGALSPFSPEHFREHFVDAVRGTLAAGAALHIDASQDVGHPHAQDVMVTSVELDVPDGEG